MTEPTRTIRVVVDRIEGRRIVLVGDDEKDHEVAASALPKRCRTEGAVLDVAIGTDGAPDWSRAVRNREEEKRRDGAIEASLKRLKARDPGGDVEL